MLVPQALQRPSGVELPRVSVLRPRGVSAACGPSAGRNTRRRRGQTGSVWVSGLSSFLVAKQLHERRAARAAGSGAEWLAGKQDEREFASEEDYLKTLELEGALPKGFQIGCSSLRFVPEEAKEMGQLPMKLTVLCLDEPSDRVAAVFTQNAFPGAPVRLGKQRMASQEKIQAIVVNNKISNVSPPDDDGGLSASAKVCEALATSLQLPGGGSSVLPSSTGVIGWRLPVAEMVEALPSAKDLSASSNAVNAAQGIMTTDRYPKLCARSLPNGGRLVGIAKGAGMIEPNMATMLCFLMTDVDLPREELQDQLSECVLKSFNAISVDGDESTSDTVVLISSQQCSSPVDPSDFKLALQEVCMDLAAQIVRNGEGTGHVIRVSVSGANCDQTASSVAKAVVNGPLFKSAIAGNDPNVGRLIGKVGQTLGSLGHLGEQMAQNCICRIGGETIFENGQFSLDTEKERRLSGHLKFAAADCESPYPEHRRVVDVEVILGGGEGPGKAVVLGSDLTTEYVKINADYRS
ncbi:Arginine biosynthesis bifunctional protein ArgJ [Durusdinium trenchii]